MKKKIFIDPGHGDRGGDFGAVGSDGTREADIVLEISKIAKKLLEKEGYEVHLSREKEVSDFKIYSDSLGDLPYRTEKANNLEADLFISIHCNAATSYSACGTEIFYYSTYGQSLAYKILNEVLYLQKVKIKKAQSQEERKLWAFPNRGLKIGSFYVLTNTDMPAVLIETLFLTNTYDLQLLKNKDFKYMYGMAIANGVKSYFKGK